MRLQPTSLALLLPLTFSSAALVAQTMDVQPETQKKIAALVDPGNGSWSGAQLETMAKIRNRALADGYALNELRHLTDNIGPRLSGSPQAQAAVEYVAAEMKALGAEVKLENAKVPHWTRGEEAGWLTGWPGGAPGTRQKIVLTALGGSEATPEQGLDAEVVAVNSFEELNRLPRNAVKGKILLLNEVFDKELAAEGRGLDAYGQAVVYRGAAPMVGEGVGAVAVLVRSVGGADYRLPHTGHTRYIPGQKRIPAAAVTAEDAEMLVNLCKQGPVKMHLKLATQTLPDADSQNVVADWKGSEHPDEVVIVSGHLDSWDLGTGAIDDGAGIAVAMQAVHLMKELGLRPRRTLRFVAWMSEEEGSQGAAAYAVTHAGEEGKHIGAIESDLGAGHPTGINYAGKPELSAWLAPISRVLQPIGAGLLDPSPETGEDIAVLTAKGVPSFAPIQDSRFYFNYHHTAADTFDKVNPRELAENAAVLAVLAYALADSPAPAPR